MLNFRQKEKGFEKVSVNSSQRNNQHRAKIVKILLQCKIYTESQIDTKKLLWWLDLTNSCTIIRDKGVFYLIEVHISQILNALHRGWDQGWPYRLICLPNATINEASVPEANCEDN
jgi:hypothetical protein